MEKIAVVRLDKIGDLILTTPAIASLRATYPNAKLTAIVNQYNAVVLEHSPLVDEIWVWKESREHFKRLQKERFEQIVVFSPTTKSYVLAWHSKANIRAGYVYKSRVLVRFFSFFWLNRRLVCQVDQKDLEKKDCIVPHEVEQNLAVVRFLNPNAVIKEDLVVPILPEKKQWAKSQLEGDKWVGIHFSRAWQEGLPQNFLKTLIKKLLESHPVFVIIGPGEYFKNLDFPFGVKIFENLSFQQWGALLGQARVVLSTNTGAVHLASSQNTPVLAVFEPKFFAYHVQRWRPWKVPHILLRKDDPELLNRLVQEVKKIAS
jgi:ADP-heptose:LPS heptosyltransferase